MLTRAIETAPPLNRSDLIRGNGAGSTVKTPLPATVSGAATVEAPAKSEPSVRNEATAAGTSYGEALAQPIVKKEVTPNAKTKTGSGSTRILRNEAKCVAAAGPHRGTRGVKAWDNSRRARRARAANERANGSGVVEKALNFTGRRARNLLIPVELTV